QVPGTRTSQMNCVDTRSNVAIYKLLSLAPLATGLRRKRSVCMSATRHVYWHGALREPDEAVTGDRQRIRLTHPLPRLFRRHLRPHWQLLSTSSPEPMCNGDHRRTSQTLVRFQTSQDAPGGVVPTRRAADKSKSSNRSATA